MKNLTTCLGAAAATLLLGCEPENLGTRCEPINSAEWTASAWISAKDAPVTDDGPKRQLSVKGTSWFVGALPNAKDVAKARWMTAGLGVYELYVNGKRIGGKDALKPGYTHPHKTKRTFTYDVTEALRTGKGESNFFAAEVSSGWWRDKIVHYAGKKSAFRGVVELQYADGTRETFGTDARSWRAGVAGPVVRAGIFDGEIYDAQAKSPFFGEGLGEAEVNTEFAGECLPSEGGEIVRRCDKAMKPVEAYGWKGTVGAGKEAFGRVAKTRTFDPEGTLEVVPGETLVVDFAQNCAAVPALVMSSKAGATITVLPGEMLNDRNGEKARGNDGPGGSLYRLNLRMPNDGMRLQYTFKGEGDEAYMPRFTFFGYRYVSITATAPVTIKRLVSVPVTSITKESELGTIETGNKDVNRLIANVYWGQMSNYLSVPTDCPQRNERLGWMADTQVFTEAGSFNADTSAFFHKWMRDVRDSQTERGGFPGVSPLAQYGNDSMRLGWADAGVIVPYQVWKQFGDTKIVDENWAAMEKYVAHVNETKFAHKAIAEECRGYQWADWLSFEKFESAGGAGKPQNSAFEPNSNGKGRRPKADAIVYWDYLGGCYWMWDAQMMAAMAKATGRDAAKYAKMAADAKAYLKKTFFKADGLILAPFRDMQTPALFALKLGLVEGDAREATIKALRANFKANGDRLQTGFLGTSILMDTLTENGMADVAYTLLFQRQCPSWLYSVDQGATTIWERWNSYVKETGFGPVGMNSFNHYAYGAVLAWIYKTAAGIAADPCDPGFKTIVMKPIPDARLGHVTASYKTRQGVVKSAWTLQGNAWTWDFTVPEGAKARVTLPGETSEKVYVAGTYRIEKALAK